MKTNITIVTAFIFSTAMYSQQWTIPGPDIVAEKQKGDIMLSYTDGTIITTVKGDTAYFSDDIQQIVIEENGLKGFFNFQDEDWFVEPSYSKFNVEIPGYLLKVKEKGKYMLVRIEDFKPVTKKYDSIYKIDSAEYETWEVLVFQKGDKKGLYLVFENYLILPVKYNAIEILGNENYIVRKGKRYGAGSCEGIEIEVKYDSIQHVFGTCVNNCWLVRKNGKYGINYEVQWHYPLEFDNITFAGRPMPYGYMILEKDGKYDVVDDSFKTYEPRFDKVWMAKFEDKVIIYMEQDGETTKIEQKLR